MSSAAVPMNGTGGNSGGGAALGQGGQLQSMTGGQAPAPGGQGSDPGQAQARQIVDEFRELAQAVQQMAQKYPEGKDEAGAILNALEQWGTKVAGNPQRVPEQPAPPTA